MRSIEKPLKASKSFIKGLKNEIEVSKIFHEKYLPLLISPIFLRERGAGQVDLAVFDKKNVWQIYLYEIKTSGFVSFKQKERLRKSAELLSQIFNYSVIMKNIGPVELGIAKDKKLL